MATRKPLVLIDGALGELPTGDTLGGTASPIVQVAKFSIVGTLPATTLNPLARWYPEEDITVLGMYFSLGEVAPGMCIAQLNKNGVDFLASNALALAGQYKSTRVVPPSPNVLTTDYLTVSFRSLLGGGRDVTVCVEYIKT